MLRPDGKTNGTPPVIVPKPEWMLELGKESKEPPIREKKRRKRTIVPKRIKP